MKRVLVMLFAALASLAAAQTAPTTTFTMNLTPVTLPGGHSSVAGVESGIALTLTPNFDVKNVNLSGQGVQFYGGGFNYRIPALSKAINNLSPTINGLQLQFYVEGAVGDVLTPAGPSSGHWGEMAGGGVNYLLSGHWALGADIQYAKFPGYANNTFTVAIGPKISF